MSGFDWSPIITGIFAAIGAIIGWVIGRPIYDYIMRPKLQLEKDERLYSFQLKNETYYVTRVRVENVGKSAAENCGGKLFFGEGENEYCFDICWIYPDERSSVTINIGDCKFLDVCALKIGTNEMYSPTERGWDDLISLGNTRKEGRIRVTAKNAKSVTRRIQITPSGDGRIFQFID